MDEYPSEYEAAAVSVAPCGICGRTFNENVLVRHQKVCQKNASKTRKVFDSTKQRAEGTDIASLPKSRQTTKPPSKTKKNNWRAKHEEFVENIRNAREVTVAIKTGKPLPPPPAQKRVNPDYEECPHCSRNFNSSAAERHIPWCKEQQKKITGTPKANSAAKEKQNIRTKYKPPLPGSGKSKTSSPKGSAGSIRQQNNSTADLDRRLDNLHVNDRNGRTVGGARGKAAASAAAGSGGGVRSRSLSRERKGVLSKINSQQRHSGDATKKSRQYNDYDDEDYGYSPHGKSPNNYSHLSANHRLSPSSMRTPTPPTSSRSHGSMRRQASLENINGRRATKFCYECGTQYPVPNAKFCCECGVKRAYVE